METPTKKVKSELQFEPLKLSIFASSSTSSAAKTSKQEQIDIAHEDLCHAIQIANKFLETPQVVEVLKGMICGYESEHQIMVIVIF